MAVISLPGQIIEDSVAQTRSTPSKEAPNYLQVDGECLFEGSKLLEVDGKAFERERIYKVAIYQFLLGAFISYVIVHNRSSMALDIQSV